MSRLEREKPKHRSGFDIDRVASIPPLRSGRYRIISQRIAGDAPKDFVRVYEYAPGVVRRGKPATWPAYIAKVGHKWYPNESITEHLLTRLGESLGLHMAASRLMSVHGQVRFLSRYFLRPKQSLVHGAEIFAGYLEDPAFVDEVEEAGVTRDLFTFQFVEEAVQARFPHQADALMLAFVRMLGFDALVGNNDRHHYNWGVVVHALGAHAPYFSPIYDSARALFWNTSEENLARRWSEATAAERNRFLNKYIKGSRPKTGCDGFKNPNHFRLIEQLCAHKASYRSALKDLYQPAFLINTASLLDAEFSDLFSAQRKEIIAACLTRRLERFGDLVTR